MEMLKRVEGVIDLAVIGTGLVIVLVMVANLARDW